MVYSRPISDHGAIHFKNVWSYHVRFVSLSTANRVMMAAPNGMPRNTATLVATVEYETFTAVEESPIIRTNRMASGAYRTICRMELTATRIAQYSVSPPARPVQMRTSSQCQPTNAVSYSRSSLPLQCNALDRPR